MPEAPIPPAPVDTEALWRLHAAELTRYAATLVGPSDAEDVVVDAFMAAVPNLGGVEQPRAYLYRAVTTRAMDRHRSDASRQRRETAVFDPHAQHVVDESYVDLYRALGDLTVTQRAAVVLTYWHDLSERMVAETLGVSPGSVHKSLERARSNLQDALTPGAQLGGALAVVFQRIAERAPAPAPTFSAASAAKAPVGGTGQQLDQADTSFDRPDESFDQASDEPEVPDPPQPRPSSWPPPTGAPPPSTAYLGGEQVGWFPRVLVTLKTVPGLIVAAVVAVVVVVVVTVVVQRGDGSSDADTRSDRVAVPLSLSDTPETVAAVPVEPTVVPTTAPAVSTAALTTAPLATVPPTTVAAVAPPGSAAAAVARFQQYARAVGNFDVATVCEIAWPLFENELDMSSPDECTELSSMVLSCYPAAAMAEMALTTVDVAQVVVVAPDRVDIPDAAIVYDRSIDSMADNCGGTVGDSSTQLAMMRLIDGEWFLIDVD